MLCMKRSDILYLILIVMAVAVAVVVFTIPQEILDNYELVFLWIVMPIMGWFWIQAYVEGMKGK